MSHASDAVAVLDADSGGSGVATLLTGGIYTFDETGRLGINRNNTPSAFDATTGLLKPCALVKDRGQVPDGGVADDGTQQVSYRQIVEVWLYDDGDATRTALDSAKARIFTLLAGKYIGGALFRWADNPLDDRAPDELLDNAQLQITAYEVRYLRT
jgi:hypothetical protein